MAIKGGVQIKVVLPGHIHEKLEKRAKQYGVSMADLVRIAVSEHWEGAFDADFRAMVEGYKAGQVSARELADRAALLFDAPVEVGAR